MVNVLLAIIGALVSILLGFVWRELNQVQKRLDSVDGVIKDVEIRTGVLEGVFYHRLGLGNSTSLSSDNVSDELDAASATGKEILGFRDSSSTR